MANFNFNKVILGGRVTSDPELKTTPTGTSVVTFTVAVNRKGKDAKTDFIRCKAWRERAEFISRYFRKGSSISVTGSLQQYEYEKDGHKITAYEVNAEEIGFVDSAADSPKPEREEDF